MMMTIGVLFAFLTALFTSAQDVNNTAKNFKEIQPFFRMIAMNLVALPLACIWYAISYTKNQLEWNTTTILLGLLSGMIATAATHFHMKAQQKDGNIGTQIIWAMTPVMLTITTPLMTNDHMSWLGWIGVFIVAIGLYIVYFPKKSENPVRWFTPLHNLWFSQGRKEKMIAICLYAISANLDKLLLESISKHTEDITRVPMLLLLNRVVMLLCSLVMSFIINKTQKTSEKTTTRDLILYGISAGILNVFTVGCHVTALGYLPVPLLISIKRLSTIFSSLFEMMVRKSENKFNNTLVIAGYAIAIIGICFMLFLK